MNHVKPINKKITLLAILISFTILISGCQPKKLEKVEVLSPPTTIEMVEGLEPSYEGLIVEAYYDNGTTKEIPLKEIIIENYDKNYIGDQEVIVKYEDKETKFIMATKAKELESIEITKQPKQLEYIEGIKINLEGISITGHYNNETSEVLDPSKVTIKEFDKEKTGDVEVSISYEEITTSYKVHITPKTLQGIKVASKPSKASYTKGQDLSLKGLKVSKIFDNDTTETIPNEELSVSGYNKNKLGNNTVKVTYGEYSDTFTVKVTEKGNLVMVSNPSVIDVVVNKKINLSSSYVPSNLVKVKIPVVNQSGNNKLKSVAADALYELYTAAKKEGLSIKALSGYRSYSTQKSIYDRNVKNKGLAYTSKYSAKPGQSEHQTGLAMDITCAAVGNRLIERFATTPEGKWVAKNAHRYGFIIRYPKGKESITGYSYEPWHLRYLGEDLATKVYESGLTLEEY